MRLFDDVDSSAAAEETDVCALRVTQRVKIGHSLVGESLSRHLLCLECVCQDVDVRRLWQPAEEVQAGVPGRAVGGQDVAHHALHVRLLRQHIPGTDRGWTNAGIKDLLNTCQEIST